MPSDPILDKLLVAGTPTHRLSARIGDLERKVAALQQATLQVVPGTPTGSPKEGAEVVDNVNTRLWLFVNGGWHYTALT